MNIDKVLLKICAHLGKDERTYKGTLKRTYNQIDKDHTTGGLKDMFDEAHIEAYEKLNLIAVLKKYKIAPSELDSFIEKDEPEEITIDDLHDATFDIEDDILDDLEDDIFPDDVFEIIEEETLITPEVEEEIKIIKKKINKEVAGKGWEAMFNTVETSSYDPDEEYEKLPSLRLIDNATFYLKLVDPNEPARPVPTTNFNKEQINYITKVMLIKLSPAELYDTQYSKGDFRGQDCFVEGEIYNLWLEEERMFKPFARFWRDTLGTLPDDRIFTIKKSKKLSKNNRWYNIFKFDLPKKRKK